MKKILLIIIAIFATLTATSAETILFYESFNKCEKYGGRDGTWEGITSSTILADTYTDNVGWKVLKVI